MNFDISNEKTLNSGKETVGSELLPEHGSGYTVGLPEQQSRPVKLREPTTNRQEIQRTEELTKCHQGNAISKDNGKLKIPNDPVPLATINCTIT